MIVPDIKQPVNVLHTEKLGENCFGVNVFLCIYLCKGKVYKKGSKISSNPPLHISSVCVVAGVAHRLHSKHGKNVVLLGEGCQAVRVGGYAHGIVFSAKELKADELFEVSLGLRKSLTINLFTYFVIFKLMCACTS